MTRKIQRWAVVASFLLLAAIPVCGQQTLNNVPSALVSYPDQIYFNGKIVTMDDPALNNSVGKTVQAMAVRGDRIQFLGSDPDVLHYAGPGTQKIDLKGRTVLPGFINTHVHIFEQSMQYWARTHPKEVAEVMKRFTVQGKNYQELTRGIELVVKEQMAHPEPGQWAWIDLPTGGSSGTGVGVNYLLEKEMDRKKLDVLAPKLPVFVLSHPSYLLNTAARNAFLDLYDVPPTDENEKIGITQDVLITRSLVADQYFASRLDELANVLEDGLARYTAAGITTFSTHLVGLRILDGHMRLVRAGRMPIRFAYSDRFCLQTNPDPVGCFLRKGDSAGLGDKFFWNTGVSMGSIDGGPPEICTTIESPKKWKDKEYCVLEPGNIYAKAIYAAIKSHLRFRVNHNYGDKSFDYFLDIVDQVMKDDKAFTPQYVKSMRMSSDHCGLYPRPAQIPRIAKLGMYISCAPMNINRSAPWLDIYGMDKANWIAPIRSMLKAGITPTAETEGMAGLLGGEADTLHAQFVHLITRKTDWGESIAPEEAIDRQELMKMSTVWPSYYVLREKEIGTLEAGKLADFVVLNRDYFTVPIDELGTVFPLMTAVGGKTMTLRADLAKEWGMSPVGLQAKFRFKTDEKKTSAGGGGE